MRSPPWRVSASVCVWKIHVYQYKRDQSNFSWGKRKFPWPDGRLRASLSAHSAAAATAISAPRTRRRYQESIATLSGQLSQDGRCLNPPRDSMVKLIVSCSGVFDQPTEHHDDIDCATTHGFSASRVDTDHHLGLRTHGGEPPPPLSTLASSLTCLLQHPR